ncbi:MAG: PIN domain-containing protein [Rubrobacteraceae bacterium]
MLLVVDASVFVAELLRRRGQRLMRDPRLDLTVSERAYEEALHELPKRADAIVDQGRMTRETINAVLQDAIELTEREVTVVPRDAYAHRIEQAAYRIPRDPDDAPTVALALALGGDEGRCGIWTQDADFLGCGIPTWTTDTLLAHLRYER